MNKMKPLPLKPMTPEAELAAELRRLALGVERGEVLSVIAKVIRADGHIERIGGQPEIIRLN